MTFLKHELRMNRKLWLVWTLIVGGMILAYMMLYPAMQDSMKEMNDAFAQMGAFSQAFGMDKMSFGDAIGYYSMEVGAMLSMGGGMFAAIVGIGMLAKEEGSHVTEFIFVTPNSRNYFIRNKIIASFILIAAFDVVCMTFGFLAFLGIGEEIQLKAMLLFHGAQFFMHLEIASIGFGISAFLRKNNVGLGIGVAILLYFFSLLSNVTEKAEVLKYFTPYAYADGADIISSASWKTELMLIGLAVMVVAVVAAFFKYNKKDLNI